MGRACICSGVYMCAFNTSPTSLSFCLFCTVHMLLPYSNRREAHYRRQPHAHHMHFHACTIPASMSQLQRASALPFHGFAPGATIPVEQQRAVGTRGDQGQILELAAFCFSLLLLGPQLLLMMSGVLTQQQTERVQKQRSNTVGSRG